MSHIKSNYRIRRQDLGTSIIQASHLALQSAMESHIIRLRQSWQFDSLTGNNIAFSMDGYGRPLWVQVFHGTGHHPTMIPIHGISISASQSICYASIGPGWSYHISASLGDNIWTTVSFGSLAATLTYPLKILALIASR